MKPKLPSDDWEVKLKVSLSQLRRGKRLTDSTVKTTIINVLQAQLDKLLEERGKKP